MSAKRPVLVLGSAGPAVAELLAKLRSVGMWGHESAPDAFTSAVEEKVRAFQTRHIGREGKFLLADGVVGPETWWALDHPLGEPQRNHLRASIPAGLTPLRSKILQVALAEHEKGVREQPSHSNRGPEVDRYLPDWALSSDKGPPWCCFFYSWVVKEALGDWPLGSRQGSCAKARERAGARKLWKPKSMGAKPIPGDAFVIDHGAGTGHIGFVLRVSEDASSINTVEGNCSDRVKVGFRSLAAPDLVGFIDNVPSEQAAEFERGVVSLAAVDGDDTR